MTFNNFLKIKGYETSFDSILALSLEDAIDALSLIKEEGLIVLGGDFYSMSSNGLVNIVVSWGSSYHCYNWFYNNENSDSYSVEQSNKIALQYIRKMKEISREINKVCYVSFVL